MDVQVTGRMLRHMFKGSGHRSILRIGPAGENRSPMACINVDTYRHFGRLGSGAVMGDKNLKGIVIQGDGIFELMENKAYPKLFKAVHDKLVDTDMMSKYHNLGTAANVALLNKINALPVSNLQQTSHPAIAGITGETFADKALLRNAACAGCPVGCIHIGFLRERFQEENRYVYRQIAYDHEPIFAQGSMLGVTDSFEVLSLFDVTEKAGLDVISSGVALAWATEALEKGLIAEKETIVPLRFGNAKTYKDALQHLALGSNDFYRILSQGTGKAARHYGGEDFACVLGQEMSGYATGEIFIVSQALGLRHSHLDTTGYAYDQKTDKNDVEEALQFFLDDEQYRVFLTSMVACLFARNVYTGEVLSECLHSLGYQVLADGIERVSGQIRKLRWENRIATGFDPQAVSIPKRFTEVTTWKGSINRDFLMKLKDAYARKILELGGNPEPADPAQKIM
jgi:aldehyde:ferredoxin oxidoreductase